MVNMDGAETIGIATKKINIDTNSMNNKINSWGDSSDSLALKAETSVTIENADFHLVSTGSITNDDTKVTYDASKVVADDSITAVGEKKRTYRSGEIHTLTVNHGSGTGPHMVDDDLTITADARPNMRFVKWVVNSGDINFPLETPVTNPFVRITMPEGNAEMTAKYEELLVFNVMPKSATAVKYIDDFYASFSWTVADTGKSITAAEIQVKNGETWEHYWYLPESKRNPGLQTYGVGAELDTVGSKTYRLLYRVDGSDVYSDEFTITWEHSEVTGIIISPKTATLGKIDMIDFNAIITEIGHCDKTVTWSVTGGSDQTQINEYGLLDVDQTEEPETTLTVTATSYDGKTASAIVTVIDNKDAEGYPIVVTERTLTVIKGASSNYKYLKDDSVEITAEAVLDGRDFDKWVSTDIEILAENATALSYTFQMPDKDVEIEATYNQSLKVINGTAGNKKPNTGESVTITAAEPPADSIFDKWVSTDITFSEEDAKKSPYTFTMPKKDITVTATYKQHADTGSSALKNIKMMVFNRNVHGQIYTKLKPEFDPEIMEYTLDFNSLDYTTIASDIIEKQSEGQTVTATWEGKSIELEDVFNHIKMGQRTFSKAISVLKINVTSKDGSSTRTYTITVKRGRVVARQAVLQ